MIERDFFWLKALDFYYILVYYVMYSSLIRRNSAKRRLDTMRDPFNRKSKAVSVPKMYFVVITPPQGEIWWGVKSGISEAGLCQELADKIGLTKQEVSGRISVTALSAPSGMEYQERDFTITQKSQKKFLKNLLVRLN